MQQMKISRPKLPLLFLMTLAIVLTSCGGADTTALQLSQSDLATQAAALQEEIVVLQASQTSSGDELVPATPSADDAEVAEPVSNEPEALPVIPRIDLGSDWFDPTNPIGVALNSGELQIIEFSAHW